MSELSTERVAALVEALHEHGYRGLTCYDHEPTPERPVWCCPCGAHELLTSWRSHVAKAAIAPLVAGWLTEAWDEGVHRALEWQRNGPTVVGMLDLRSGEPATAYTPPECLVPVNPYRGGAR